MPKPRTSSRPGERRGRPAEQAVAVALDLELIVGDQQRAGIDQPQREVRLAAARGAQQHDADAAELDAGRVQPDVRGLRRCPRQAGRGRPAGLR